jgi:hypothetical protein
MRCQHVDRDSDTQCRMHATLRVMIVGGDHRTPTRRDSRGPSTWSRSARSTTPTPGSRCRSRGLLGPCPSGNVRGASNSHSGHHTPVSIVPGPGDGGVWRSLTRGAALDLDRGSASSDSRPRPLALTQTTTVPMIATAMLASRNQYPTSCGPNPAWVIRTPIHVSVQTAMPATSARGVHARRRPIPKSAITPTVAAPANRFRRAPTCSNGLPAPSQISRNSEIDPSAGRRFQLRYGRKQPATNPTMPSRTIT